MRAAPAESAISRGAEDAQPVADTKRGADAEALSDAKAGPTAAVSRDDSDAGSTPRLQRDTMAAARRAARLAKARAPAPQRPPSLTSSDASPRRRRSCSTERRHHRSSFERGGRARSPAERMTGHRSPDMRLHSSQRDRSDLDAAPSAPEASAPLSAEPASSKESGEVTSESEGRPLHRSPPPAAAHAGSSLSPARDDELYTRSYGRSRLSRERDRWSDRRSRSRGYSRSHSRSRSSDASSARQRSATPEPAHRARSGSRDERASGRPSSWDSDERGHKRERASFASNSASDLRWAKRQRPMQHA